jgi:hypothetical protein
MNELTWQGTKLEVHRSTGLHCIAQISKRAYRGQFQAARSSASKKAHLRIPENKKPSTVSTEMTGRKQAQAMHREHEVNIETTIEAAYRFRFYRSINRIMSPAKLMTT